MPSIRFRRFALVMVVVSTGWAIEAAAQSQGGRAIGPDPAKTWEGAFDYAVVGGSVLRDTCTPQGALGCRPPPDGQADAVIAPGSFATTQLAGIPDGSEVQEAFLIWMASYTPGRVEPDTSVVFAAPDADEQVEVTADLTADCTVLSYNDRGTLLRYYACRKDVTAALRRHAETNRKPLNGPWQLGFFEPDAGDPYRARTNVLGAWSVVIVYRNPAIARKRLYYYEGFDVLQCGERSFTLAGFEAPAGAGGKITVFTGEGDQNVSGTGIDCAAGFTERLVFGDRSLTDGDCNPENNIWNQTVNTNTSPTEDRCRRHRPPGTVNESVLSLDLDTYDLTGLLTEGQTSAPLKLSTGTDLIFTNFVILSIDTQLPSFDIPGRPEKTIVSPTGGTLATPDGIIEYEIVVQNHGQDTARNVVVVDETPEFTSYVCNSTTLDGTAVPDAGDCGNPLAGAGLKVADAMTVFSGTGPQHVVRFKVKVDGEGRVTKETIILNQGVIRSQAPVGGNLDYFTNGSIPTRIGIQVVSYDGTIRIDKGPADPGGGVLVAGATRVPLLQLRLRTDGGPGLLSSFGLAPDGTLKGADAFSGVEAWLDGDNNGAVGPADTLLKRSTITGDNRLSFADMTPVRIENTPIDVLVTGDVTQSPGTGTLRLGLPDETYLARSGTLDDSRLPINSGEFRVATGGVVVARGAAAPGSGPAAAGETFVAHAFDVTAVRPGVGLTGARITGTNAHTAAWGGSIGAGRLLVDGNNNGPDGTDDVLATAQLDATGAQFTFSRGLLQGTPLRVYVELTLTAGATAGTVVETVLAQGALTFSGDAGTVEGLPIVGPRRTVGGGGDTDIETDGDTGDADDGGGDNDRTDTIDTPDFDFDTGGDDDPAGPGTKKKKSGCAGGTPAAAWLFGALAVHALLARRRRAIDSGRGLG